MNIADDDIRTIGRLVREEVAGERVARLDALATLTRAMDDTVATLAVMREQVAAVANARAELTQLGTDTAASLAKAMDGALEELTDAITAMQEGTAEELADNFANLKTELTSAIALAMAEKLGALQAHVLAALAALKDGEPGPRGEPGERGQDASLGDVRVYMPGEIYRAGECVALPRSHPLGWAIAKAVAETFDIPGDDDAPWIPVVYHGETGADGMDGKGFRFRGQHHASVAYRLNDVVIADGGAVWVRCSDAESMTIPGEGWAVMLRAPRAGPPGARGEPGPEGPGIVAMEVAGTELVATLSNGTQTRCPLPIVYIGGGP